MAENAPWNEETAGAAANEEWGAEVESESQIVLEVQGEGWTGTFLEMDKPNANGIVQAHFENVTALDGMVIGDGFINAGRDLQGKLKKVPPKSEVRIQWVTSMDTGQRTPMRVFKVQWR